MRRDMAQLLVEQPRRHAGELYRVHRRRLNRDLDGGSTKQGMRRPYVERKEFGEYFAPIRGYLRANVGRPWDKVFSELVGSLSGGGTVIDHVKVHVLRDFVITQPVWHNGEACYPYHSYYHPRHQGPQPIYRRRNGGFYVDQQGILRQAPRQRPRKIETRKVERVGIDNHTAYHKIDGHWYRVWTKDLNEPSAECVPVYEVLLRKWVKVHARSTYWEPTKLVWEWYVEGSSNSGIRELVQLHGSARVAYRKEQISNRTIRREKLNERLR